MSSVRLAKALVFCVALGATATAGAQTKPAPQQPKLEIVMRQGDFYWVVETAPDGSRRGGWVNVQVSLDSIDRNALKPLPAQSPTLPNAPQGQQPGTASLNERLAKIEEALAAGQGAGRDVSTQPAASVQSAPLADPVAQPRSQAATQQQQQTQAPQQKSMAATVLFWLLIPGGGNFYNGAVGNGFLELGGTIAGVAMIATAYEEECYSFGFTVYCEDVLKEGQAWAGIGTIAGFRVWGLISAINRTSGINSGKISPFERIRFTIPTKKDGFKVAYSHNW